VWAWILARKSINEGIDRNTVFGWNVLVGGMLFNHSRVVLPVTGRIRKWRTQNPVRPMNRIVVNKIANPDAIFIRVFRLSAFNHKSLVSLTLEVRPALEGNDKHQTNKSLKSTCQNNGLSACTCCEAKIEHAVDDDTKEQQVARGER
jgi:hypothetical protein